MGSKPSSAPSGSPGRGCREPARSARQPTGCHQLSQARAAEFGARERFVKAYDSNIGAIRQLFPRDRDQQDLYFDEAPSSRSSSDDKGGDTPTPPTPATDTKPK